MILKAAMGGLFRQKVLLLIFTVMTLVGGIQGIGYAQLPSFSNAAVTRSVAENSPTGTDIGDPVIAVNFSSSTDRYRLAIPADNADSPDSDSFGIGSTTGQLTTNVALDFETKQTYKVVVIAERDQGGSWVEATSGSRITVTINVTNVFEYTPLSGRTQQVVDEIVFRAPVSTASAVTEAHLRAITQVLINNKSINSLKEKDFDGLSSLSAIWLNNNNLTGLPENVFSGLSNLTQLLLQYNQLTSLPENAFSGLSSLTTLRLEGNQLTSLPDGAFRGVTKLNKLNLSSNTANPVPLTISFAKIAEGEFRAVVPAGAPFRMVLHLTVANGTIDSGATTFTIPAGAVESNNSLTVTRIPGTTHAVTVDYADPLPSLPSNHEGYALTKSADLPLSVITKLNSPPVFNEDVNATPTIAENTAANTNIGTPLTAMDVDDDPVTYRLIAHADDADDYLAFDISSDTGQLKTKASLDHETQPVYKVTVETSDDKSATNTIDVTITLLDVYEYKPVNERTQQVVDEILFRSPVSMANAVTEDHLEAITQFLLNNESITSLKEKDFEGLWAMQALWLHNNQLTSLPDNIFSGLTSLETLILSYNVLSSLDADVFNGLSSLKTLRLEDIDVSSLPGSIFSGLSELEAIHLNNNQLSSLPDGVFSGLTSLTQLYMNGNTANPLPLTVSLVRVAEGQFKAVVPAGAPFEMVLHLTVTNGSIDGGATSVTVPKGSVESNTLTVTRTPYTAAAVTVDIRTPLPRLPAAHQGYAVTKSNDLPVTVIAEIPNNTPVFNTGLNTTPEIAENTAAGTNIGTPLTATDADSTDTLTYSLMAHADDADDYLSFAIDGNTGQLKTKNPPDHETQSTYKVTVKVSDNIVIATINVTITITNVNEAPIFPATETGTRSIPDDVAVNVNIGAAVSATDPDLTSANTDANPDTSTADTLTYSLSGDDAASFNIDAMTGQLKTKTGVTFDAAIKDTYNVTVSVSDGEFTATINVTITVVGATQFNYAPIFDTGLNTTPSIAENTVAGTNIGTPLTAMDADTGDTLTYSLKAHTEDADDYLAFAIDNMGQLKTKANLDFEVQSTYKATVEVSDGTATATIDLTITITNVFEYTPLGERTQQVADEIVFRAPVSTADAVTEAHIEAITLFLINNKSINSLKEKDFEGMPSLTAIWLNNNNLTGLPENVFSGLSNVTQLLLQYNDLTSLPENVFSGLSSLTTLRLEGNQLSSLPPNLFAGHTKLTKLILSDNTVSPLPLTISFAKIAEGEFKAVVPSGAPFNMVLHLTVVNGTVDGGATTLTVPQGSVESSNSLTVTRIPGTTHAVTVDFAVPLPSLPSNHEGYALTKSADLPLPVIAKLNSPPVFNEDVNTTPTIAENTAANTNIGTPLTATDVDDDPITYRLVAHTDDADDYLSFTIDNMAQLKTEDPLNHETQSVYRITVEASDGNGGITPLDVTITLLDLYEYTLMSDRTQQVVDEVLFRAPVSTADAVTEAHLEAIPYLLLDHESITSLKAKDFEGLWAMQSLWLHNNQLTSLPDNIFSGLSSLDTLLLNYNPLGSLDADVFSDLTSLKTLRLEGIQLTSLPANIFNGLSKLQEIHLNYNQLMSLPAGVFSGLTSLTQLYMNGNTVSPLPLPVSLVKVAGGQFKAVAPTGAPFKLVLQLTVENGTIEGGATTVTIAQGSVESRTLTVTRTSGTTAAVTVDIGTPLPRLPASHQGYAITKSSDLPLTVIAATETSPPVFNTGLNTTPEVVENAAANIDIGTPLTATDADTGDTLTYRLMAHTGDADDYLSFAIDANTGQLKTEADLDFETQSTYKVTVEVTDAIFTTTIDVTITVTDVNEAPTFPADTDTRSIAENTRAGVNIGSPVAANDPDTADGDTDVNPDDPNVDSLTYSLGGTDAASFDIDTATGQLKTKAALDYETKDDYEVTITASDGGTDTASVIVTINIIDVDDTPPTVKITSAITVQNDKFGVTFTFSEAVSGFDDAATDISLTTTLTEGTGNARVTSLALVTGSDTQYTAEITPPTNAEGSVAIQVPAGAAQDAAANGNTASSEYIVPVDTIIPSVRITAPMTATGAFSVIITFSEDMTEFDNLVTDIMLGGRAAATVTSLAGGGTTYTANIAPTSNGNLNISVPKNAAKDKANNGNAASQIHTVSIGLTGPSVAIQGVPTEPQNSAFSVTITFSESVTGFVATDISLGENVSATVMLTAVQGSDTQYTATITPADNVEEEITLSVPADAAQNAASMGNTASSEYPIQLDTVQPTVTITAPTTAVTVFDVTITFSENVTGFSQSDISLTNSTATTALTDFTIENAKKYTATITPTSNGNVVVSVPAGVAKDAAENQNTASNMSSVTVELNNAPSFITGLNIIPTIAENTAAGENIGTPLTATDADTGDMLTYRLKAHADDADDYLAFAIDEDTGQLKTKDPLDHETQSTYEVTVEVSDSIATAIIDVTITITNVNEVPAFATETAIRKVAENTAANTNIGTAITATDPDSGDTLTYSIDATADAVFGIDGTTGQLETEAALDYETKTSYTVTVTATDSGNLTDTITITINIGDVNEAPTFPSTIDITMEIAENTAADNSIGDAVAATDPDTADGDTDVNPDDVNVDTLTYSLADASDPTSDDAAFDIDAATGQLKTKAALDYETKTSYTVTVKVSDGEFTPTIEVTITITDVDEMQPTVTITDVPSTTQNDAFEVTITFSEAVTLTGSGNITTTDSVSRMYSLSGTGTTYTATFSRIDGEDGNVILKVPAGFAKDSADNENTESGEHTVPVDWKDPTVTVAVPSDTQTAAFDVTITFSEAVTGFEASDLSLSGTASATAALTGSGTTYTANITPTSSGNVKIKVDADAAEDAAGNGNTESQSRTVAVSLSALTVTITGVPTTPQNSAFDITIEFSETVTGFETGDISLGENVSAAVSLTAVQGSDTQYTATITPADNVEEEIVISVPAGAVQNAANTDNTASSEHRVQLDTVKPSVTLMGPSGTQTGVFEVAITFLEAVTGFEASDISLSGTASATSSLTGSGTTYTATIIPTTNGDVNIKVPAGAAQDNANNGNTESATLTVTVMLADPVDRPDPLMYVKQGDVVRHDQTVTTNPFELIISFGQPVTGFEQSDLELKNFGADATITGWEKSADSKTYTVTVTPKGEGSVTFTVPENVTHAADDGQGNVERKLNVQVDGEHDPSESGDEDEEDNTAPRVRTIQTPSGVQGGAFDVTITFSESVIGFEKSDIALSGTANASVTALTGSESVYTATITPEPNADGDVLIQVPAGVVKDNAENENTASDTRSVRVNLTRPTVTITNLPTRPQNSAFSVTIRFSKLVTGFEVGDISLTGATATVSGSDDDSVYTATITPTRSGDISIQVRANAVRDSANRGNIASETYTVSADLTRPTVTITNVPTTTQSGLFIVTITFSERVFGFRAGDISLTGDTGTTATLSGGGSVFPASIQPTRSGDVSIQVPPNVAKDAAGNANEASQSHTVSVNLGGDSDNVEIDNRLEPIIFAKQNGVEKYDQTVAPGTFQLIIDFGQPVTGFERSELSVFDFNTGVTITGWQRSSDGKQYTATVQVRNTGGVTFTVPANAAEAVDDGRGNPEQKFTVLVREAAHSGAPMVRAEPPLPNETLLLPNYPNPFNPETWIPYQLAQDADVQILIYDVHGTIVRRLTLGHQPAGFYTNRTRAAHWDGCNSFGEDVANGVYFYQLHTRNISPLRKMLILK